MKMKREALLWVCVLTCLSVWSQSLRLAPIYGSGMVLQHGRELTLSGEAAQGNQVTVELGDGRYMTRADESGRWRVNVAPLRCGSRYDLMVTDRRDTLKFTDIVAGEVWLASGQSNMEFLLQLCVGGERPVSTDSLLRVYDMRSVVRANPQKWEESEMAAVDSMHYYKPAHWTPLGKANALQFSGVAYYFARMLRDSLNVPVGIISNAVGGAPIESWCDIADLQREYPEAAMDRDQNKVLQPWAVDRADENVGKLSEYHHRHPYDPGYLYEVGIRPLEDVALAGVIWYQGESNAHDVAAHERLFPIWLKGWRRHFGNDSLPVVFAQLSGINRQTWPEFRDSQRRMSDSLKRVYMAVTMDVGDSIDVHPRNKYSVGQRLGRQALHNVYGMKHVNPCGPQPVAAAMREPGCVEVRFAVGSALTTRDGGEPTIFEMAEADGVFYPATAQITSDNIVTISNMKLKSPRYVRYGWQPFTRANLVDADSLPTSTFSIKVDAESLQPEQGLEAGVSAPFAAGSGRWLMVAGGCNFPVEPLAPTSVKKYYKGIYVADTASLAWSRAADMPVALAYGATAVTPGGVVMIGGIGEEGASRRVMMLNVAESGSVSYGLLPELPVDMDNMAAAAIGSKVYTAGGNVNGVPSRSLYMLDVENPQQGWIMVAQMPGNPRVQPAMAAAADASGEECLYLWGGFAPRHAGYDEPTLELDGLCYKPSTGQWKSIDGPKAAGVAVGLGGGVACRLSSGLIAACGGVNKDVFISALRKQPDDYLQHPIEWYRFNPYTFVFDPQLMKWLEMPAAESVDTARAGAAMIAGEDNDFYLIGGELKPRIRTPHTLHCTITPDYE